MYQEKAIVGFIGAGGIARSHAYSLNSLKKDYRDKRASRLTPAPDGGAMADLGSHAISMLVAFLGNNLRITGAMQAGCLSELFVPGIEHGLEVQRLVRESAEHLEKFRINNNFR